MILTVKRRSAKELTPLNYSFGETSQSFLDSKEIKPVNLKGTQPQILNGSTDAEAKFWSSDVNS